ncbi:ABC transporter ATP-binding protein [Paracoccus aminovorans]|uniref:ABC transporter ATP-binding protein n=1 Tax=Paracoccus aminovorans TaxID=34004 RepID=UPI002B25E9E5|nr:ABC transporter ATP-binding protein [Paracoccus aminovorans]
MTAVSIQEPTAAAVAPSSLLSVRGLTTRFHLHSRPVTAVDGISFDLKRGEVVAIVGESGCGKSITAFSIMGLLSPPGRVDSGEVLFEGRNLATLSREEMRDIQGNRMSMIFQEPLTSLNPLLTIGFQLDEPIRAHLKLGKAAARERSLEMLRKVGMPRPEAVHASYPHELSGGMRQRVMIAMALSCNPSLLIADEPTTALDVTIQAQILELMKDLRQDLGMTIVLITHDLGVVAEMADRVIVMYGGQIVEQGDTFSLFRNPAHPYTQGLLNSTPNIHELRDRLEPIKGTVPPLTNMPKGCRFHPRCPYAFQKCVTAPPEWVDLRDDHQMRCWLPEKEERLLHEHR